MSRRTFARIPPAREQLRTEIAIQLHTQKHTPFTLNEAGINFHSAKKLLNGEPGPRITDKVISLAKNQPAPRNPWPTLTTTFDFQEYAARAKRYYILADLHYERRSYRFLSFAITVPEEDPLMFPTDLTRFILTTADGPSFRAMKPTLHPYTRDAIQQSRLTIEPGLRKLLAEDYVKIMTAFGVAQPQPPDYQI